MTAKRKQIKITLTDLNTGRKKVSYSDTDKTPKPPEWLTTQWAKIAQIGVIIDPDFISVITGIKKAKSFGLSVQKLYRGLAWVYKLKEQKKDSKPVSTRKARMIKSGEKALKASNQILGLVCFYAGLFTTQQIKEFLTNTMKIQHNKGMLREVARFRNNYQKFDYKKKTVREIQAFLGILMCAYDLMTEFKIKGKRKVTNTRKAIERLFFENKTGLLYQE